MSKKKWHGKRWKCWIIVHNNLDSLESLSQYLLVGQNKTKVILIMSFWCVLLLGKWKCILISTGFCYSQSLVMVAQISDCDEACIIFMFTTMWNIIAFYRLPAALLQLIQFLKLISQSLLQEAVSCHAFHLARSESMWWQLRNVYIIQNNRNGMFLSIFFI